MVVADFPTKYSEDRTGVPLMGGVNTEFNGWLSAGGWSREEVFFTMLNKCSPPIGKKPSKKELDNCAPYLEEELEIVKPKVVIAMSARVFNYFLPKEKKGRVTYNKFLNRLYKKHKVSRDWGTFEVIPIISPAYAYMSDRLSAGRRAIELLFQLRMGLA
jgi:DNA polymerase